MPSASAPGTRAGTRPRSLAIGASWPTSSSGPTCCSNRSSRFVLRDTEDRPAGYIVGTPDTPRFVAAYQRDWLPRVAGRYPRPGAKGIGEGRDAERIHDLHHPEWMLRDDLRDYPAHLHIALAPEAQGKGAGRALMETYLTALRAAGVPRVHLSMSAANAGARAFYDRLGFHQIARPTPTRVLMGRQTHPLVPSQIVGIEPRSARSSGG